MGEIIVRQAVLHGLIAAAFVEVVLGVWDIRRPESRLPFWTLSLAFPFLILPAWLVAAPFRTGDRFANGWALFSSARWNAVTLAGIGVDTLVIGVLALTGLVLFLRDAVPLLTEAVRERREGERPQVPAPAHLVAAVARRAHALSIPRAPSIVLLDDAATVLFVRGLARPSIVISTGLLSRVPPEPLEAALVHELTHVRFHDPMVGWVLMGVRLLMFWNPAVQLVARAVADEMERRADGAAARATTAAAFGEALQTLASPTVQAGTPGGRNADGTARTMRAVMERAYRIHVEERVAALPVVPAAPRFMPARLAVAGMTLATLLFFVV